MSEREIYFAAPFFNPAEVAVCLEVENLLAAWQRKHFSPRKDAGNAERQGDVRRNAKSIFDANERALRRCTEVVAWLDRPQVPGLGICLCAAPTVAVDRWTFVSGPFEQTDLGVAWELGWVKGFNEHEHQSTRKKLTGFSLKPRGTGKINLMLTQCLDFVIHGYEELNAYLEVADVREIPRGFTIGWKGDVS